jgi:hypothetical protein
MYDNVRTHALVNETEAARILDLSVKTLRRWRWARKGPAYSKIGAAVRYDPTDLAAFIALGKHLGQAA